MRNHYKQKKSSFGQTSFLFGNGENAQKYYRFVKKYCSEDKVQIIQSNVQLTWMVTIETLSEHEEFYRDLFNLIYTK